MDKHNKNIYNERAYIERAMAYAVMAHCYKSINYLKRYSLAIPILSFIAIRKLDVKILCYCKKLNLKYSDTFDYLHEDCIIDPNTARLTFIDKSLTKELI